MERSSTAPPLKDSASGSFLFSISVLSCSLLPKKENNSREMPGKAPTFVCACVCVCVCVYVSFLCVFFF